MARAKCNSMVAYWKLTAFFFVLHLTQTCLLYDMTEEALKRTLAYFIFLQSRKISSNGRPVDQSVRSWVVHSIDPRFGILPLCAYSSTCNSKCKTLLSLYLYVDHKFCFHFSQRWNARTQLQLYATSFHNRYVPSIES